MVTNRRGKFSVNNEVFTADNYNGNIFKDMKILDVEHDFYNDRVKYIAIHPSFKECTKGQVIPTYTATIKDGQDYPEWNL